MQFSNRHFFYLEFINLWCIGFVLQIIWVGFRQRKIYNKQTIQYIIQRSKIVVPFFSGIICISLIALWGARIYQTYHLQQLFTYYLQAKTNRISTKDVVIENGKTLIEVAIQNKSREKYLKIHLAPDCTNKIVNFTFKFEDNSTGNASGNFMVNEYKNATVFYPIYKEAAAFKGIEVASKNRHCINDIAVVAEDPNINLWPILWLPEDWKNKKLYQRFNEVHTKVITSNNPPLKLFDLKINTELSFSRNHQP